MIVNFKMMSMRKLFYKFGLSTLTAIMAGVVLPSVLYAQDAAVVPANNNEKVPWVNGTTFSSAVQATATGWTSPTAITDNNTSNAASISHNTAGTFTDAAGISNGETFRTKPFTGYRIGVVASRSGSLSILAPGHIVIRTYKDGVMVESSEELSWAVLGDTDAGFYAHEAFDSVSVHLTSTRGLLGSFTHNVKHVYFQRYTRFGGGFDNVGNQEVTCNAQIPLTGRGLEASGDAFTIVGGIPVYVPASLWPGLVPAMEDEDPNTHGTIPYVNLGASYYKGGIKDLAVVYPGGTLGGAVYNLSGAFTSVIFHKKLNFYMNNTLVHDTSTYEVFNATVNGDYFVVGDVCPVPFNRIEYEINMTFSGGVGIVEAYYPVVQRFCDATITCTNQPVSLIAGVQGGAQNHPVYANAIGTSAVNIAVGDPGIANAHHVTDGNLNNYATIGDAVASGALYSNYGISVVSEQTGGYASGTFAGFEIEETDWAAASFSKKYIISTYLNGALVENYSNQDLIGVNFFTPNKGRHIIGFKTTSAFDEIRISVEKIVSTSALSGTRVYRAVIEQFCPTDVTALTDCNALTKLKRSNGFPVFIDNKNTGIVGIGTGNTYFEDLNNLVSSTTSPAKLYTTIGATITASVAIQDGSKTATDKYPKGTFAGFDVAFPTVAAGQLFGSSITVSLLNEQGNVIHSEVMNSSFFGAHSSLLSGTTARQVIGYAAPVPFSGVKLTINKNASVSWGVIEIYAAVIQRFCEQDIACDVIDQLRNPEHPVYINGKNTGVNAFADGNSTIVNSQNAIDANALNYAALQLGATVGAEIAFSVANGAYNADSTKYHYPAKTYVGFDVETQDWFQLNGFYQTKLELYRNGLLVQTSTGDQLGGGVSSSLITGGWQRNIIGTVAKTTFDEARLVVQRLAGISVGEIRIYDFIARSFDTAASCAVTEIQCDTTIVLTDNNGAGLTIPAVVEFDRTGYTGVVSGGYGIEDVWNVVSPSNADYATIHLPAAGATTGSIAVAAPGVVFPAGTHAGFSVEKQNFIISGGLFTGVTVTTYLNGMQQEIKTDAALADFTLLTQWFGTPADFYTPGFETTLPFNEVRITIGGLASGLDQTLRVYGAYVDTRGAVQLPNDGTTPLVCSGPDLTPSSSITNGTFTISAGTSRNYIANIGEIAGKSTTNATQPVYVRISKSANFEYSFNPSATTLSGTTVHNSDWNLISNTATGMVFQLKSTVEIPAYGVSKIGIIMQVRPTATMGTVNVQTLIFDESGGEANNTNNITLRQLIIQ